MGGNLTIEGEQTSIGGIEWIGIREDVTADEVASNRGGIGEWSGSPVASRHRKQDEARRSSGCY